jgi:hypothetical protein
MSAFKHSWHIRYPIPRSNDDTEAEWRRYLFNICNGDGTLRATGVFIENDTRSGAQRIHDAIGDLLGVDRRYLVVWYQSTSDIKCVVAPTPMIDDNPDESAVSITKG